MSGRIKQDEKDFLDIMRGKIRKDLLKYIKRGQITIMGPGRGVAIPVEEIQIPHIHFAPIPEDAEINEGDNGDDNDIGPDIGIGEGPGEPGTDLGIVDPYDDDGDGKGEEGEERYAGTGRGSETIEIEVPAEDFYELFKETLELPNIKPKGEKEIKTESRKYTDIRPVGPESLLQKKRTYRQALKRSISEGLYNPRKPVIIPTRQDKRYRVPELVTKPKNNAVVINMMDVSGSMSRDDRALVRYFCALCEYWLKCNYDGVETVWIIHNGEADRVSRDNFFSTQRGGGTIISTAHIKMLEIIEKEYPATQWNIYPFYFSDGFNIGGDSGMDDNDVCTRLIHDKILSIVNQYTYCEVNAGRYWWPRNSKSGRDPNKKFDPSGSFGKMLSAEFKNNPLVICANLREMDKVPDAIKSVFNQGH